MNNRGIYHLIYCVVISILSGSAVGYSTPLTDRDRLVQVASQSGHFGGVLSVAYNRKLNILASAGADDLVLLWDLKNNRVLRRLNIGIVSVDFSPDGQTVVCGGSHNRTVTLWNVSDGTTRNIDLGKTPEFSMDADKPIEALAVSRKTNKAVAVCHDFSVYVVSWNSRSVSRKFVGFFNEYAFELNGKIYSAAISDDGACAAVSGYSERGDMITVIDLHRGTSRNVGTDGFNVDKVLDDVGLPTAATCVVFERDSHVIVCGCIDGYLGLWDPASRRAKSYRISDGESITCLAIDSTGTHMLTGSTADGGCINSWRISHGSIGLEARYSAQLGKLLSIEYGPVGSFITGGADHAIRFWRKAAPLASSIISGVPAVPEAATFSPNESQFAVAMNDRVFVWDLAHSNGPSIAQMHDGAIRSLAYLDNSHIVTYGATSVRTWDIQQATVSKTYALAPAVAVCLSPYGTLAAVGISDGQVLVLDTQTGTQLQSLHIGNKENGINSVALSPNGKMLAVTASGPLSGEAAVFNLTSPAAVMWGLLNDAVEEESASPWGYATVSSFDTNNQQVALGLVDEIPEGSSHHSGYNQTYKVEVTDLNTGRSWLIEDAHSLYVTALLFVDHTRLLVSASQDGTAVIWDLTTGKKVCCIVRPFGIAGLAYSSQRHQLVCVSQDGSVAFYDISRFER